MVHTTLPQIDMNNSETGCCPRFQPAPWDEQEFEFHDRLFVLATTRNFLHIPLNIGSVMKATWSKIVAAEAALPDTYLTLSTDPTPWRGEHYFAVTKEVPNCQMTRLSGTYQSKVYEGPYSDARKWVRDMEARVVTAGKRLEKLYFFYTTCPKCAKHYGKNYVVAFAQV